MADHCRWEEHADLRADRVREDACRVRKGNAPQNLAALRRIALNLLRREQTAKCSIRAKRLKAAWDNDYLLKVLLC